MALFAGDIRHAQGFARKQGDRHVFSLRLDRLTADTGGLALQPAVGGLVLPPVLNLPADALAHVGILEACEPWRVRGWAFERAAPARPVALDLYLDGALVTSLVADRLRDDVAAAGFGDGLAGFDIALPAPLDRAILVDVRIPGGPSLGNSPFLRPAAPRFVGWFDRLDSFSAGGWAIDLAETGRPVTVQALCDGDVIGVGQANFFRGDVVEAGLPIGACGFDIRLDRPAGELVGKAIALTIAGTGLTLQGSPRTVPLNANAAAFLGRVPPRPAVLNRLRRRLTHAVRDVLVSIVMPVHETPRAWLQDAIASVQAQYSDNWELICVDDGSTAPHVHEILQAAAIDARIRVVQRPENGGIARAVNDGIAAARGEYVAFLDHDDALEPDAVYHLARAAQTSGAGLIYSDEVVTGPSLDEILELRARPAWSHDYYRSHPYFVHLVAVRTTLARELGGYDETMAISVDIDFVLRAVERTRSIAHIPRVLYRWRTSADSAGQRRRDEVMAATSAALDRHHDRLGSPARISPGLGFNQYRLDWPDDDGEILIVIPTKDRVDLLQLCIDSIAATAAGARHRIVVIDHDSREPATIAYLNGLAGRHVVLPYRGVFNFARMNNWAVAQAGGDARYVLFLNNDVEAIEAGWLGRLRSLAARPEVGAVGPLLLYDNDSVQHAGVVIGLGGTADHAMRFATLAGRDVARDPGYNASLTSLRDFSAVTAACMMLRRDVFDAAGGFDEGLAVNFNDTDLCLRLRAAGLKVLYDGHTVLRHHESATRMADAALLSPAGDDARFRARWPDYLQGRDPFYNPALSLAGIDHRLREDRVVSATLEVRVSPALPIDGDDYRSKLRATNPNATET